MYEHGAWRNSEIHTCKFYNDNKYNSFPLFVVFIIIMRNMYDRICLERLYTGV